MVPHTTRPNVTPVSGRRKLKTTQERFVKAVIRCDNGGRFCDVRCIQFHGAVLCSHQTIVMEHRFAGLHRLRIRPLSFALLPWGHHGSENVLEEESEQKRFRRTNMWIFM